jgi:elongation factor P
MLSMNDLKTGVVIELSGEPFQVLESHHVKIAQRRPVMQTKLRSLKTGKVLAQTFQQSDKIPEADIEKIEAGFSYRTRTEFFFTTKDGKKFGVTEGALGDKSGYLTKDLPVELLMFEEEPLSVELPIKISLRVKDAPPGAKGNTVQGGLKDVTLETGAVVKTPLFVKEGDIVEIDSRTGEYVRRV